MMRLQKYLALSGVASRRNAEKMILEGRISVNHRTVTEMGFLVVGEVTTVSDPEGRATVMDKFRDFPVRLYPVGRLDYDSEGLLLLTNDGDMMNHVLHPSREVSKVYLAKVSNQVTDDEIRMLRRGVAVDGKLTSPASVRLIRRETFDTVLLISIHEGRNRQVRKMVQAIGHQVVSLKRVEFGPVALGNLPSGKWRRLTENEIRKLKSI